MLTDLELLLLGLVVFTERFTVELNLLGEVSIDLVLLLTVPELGFDVLGATDLLDVPFTRPVLAGFIALVFLVYPEPLFRLVFTCDRVETVLLAPALAVVIFLRSLTTALSPVFAVCVYR